MDAVHVAATVIVLGSAALRGTAVIIYALRTFLMRRRFARLEMGILEAVTTAEPFLLVAVTVLVATQSLEWDDPSFVERTAAIVGAVLVLAGGDLVLWSIRSWRGLFFGHGIMVGQQLVTGGAYGFVRHPVYLGAILIWLGLGFAFLRVEALAIAALYVAPAYYLYARSEERLMAEAFGDEYATYRRNVPMLFPRIGRRLPAKSMQI